MNMPVWRRFQHPICADSLHSKAIITISLIMKKTAITLLTLAGMATADTIIYNLGNQDTTFGEYTDVHFVQSGGV